MMNRIRKLMSADALTTKEIVGPIPAQGRLENEFIFTSPNQGDVLASTEVDIIGNGQFGEWFIDDLDENGLPAYEYTVDQHQDPIAEYPNSEHIKRTDHWHQIGNNRITGLVSNDGFVQAYVADRGGMFLNHFDPSLERNRLQAVLLGILLFIHPLRLRIRNFFLGIPDTSPGLLGSFTELNNLIFGKRKSKHHRVGHYYVGGFGYIDDGAEKWSTAYRYRPAGTDVKRVFGMGYFETTMDHREIHMVRHVYAPPGDDPVLLADVTLTNTGTATKTLQYYEYWDVNVLQLHLQWTRTAGYAPVQDTNRRRINREFEGFIDYHEREKAIRFRQEYLGDERCEDRNKVNYCPPDLFLMDLSDKPSEHFCFANEFFGNGGPQDPDAIYNRGSTLSNTEREQLDNEDMPYCMVLRRDVVLKRDESVSFRFAYGTVKPNEDLKSIRQSYAEGNVLGNWRDELRKKLVYFTIGSTPALQREMAWHAYYMLSSTVYYEYFNTHVTPQGSAYLYLHGADGAPRDYSLYVLALTYFEPALAKEMLTLIMRMTDADTHQIIYSVSGHGHLDGALGLHENPSDLDLFFLLAFHEYISVTGDMAFLQEEIPFYPKDSSDKKSDEYDTHGATVLDHIIAAVYHLMHVVGRGENGLIRVSDGDWSDGVVIENILRLLPTIWWSSTIGKGESVSNSQMAIYVLPRIAAFLQSQVPEHPTRREQIEALVSSITRFVTELRQAVQAQWEEDKNWYTRGILRGFLNMPTVLWELDLEAQVWALIGQETRDDRRRNILVKTIREELDVPSPIGAPLSNGAVWPAISQLLTWGYTRSHPQYAWDTFWRNTLIARANTYGHIWFNIWSGPDGVNTAGSDKPGGTWVSPVTPITDFPTANNNTHAMALLGLFRVCGIEPLADASGLRITPQYPDKYILDMPMLRLDVTPRRILGEYRARVTGTRNLHICKLADHEQILVRIDGSEVETVIMGDYIILTLDTVEQETVYFEIVVDVEEMLQDRF